MNTLIKLSRLGLIAGWLVAVCLLAVPKAALAQFATPTLDCTISSGEYSNNNSGVWYMTWDDTWLYIAKTGGSSNEPVIVYLDIDPQSPVINSGSSGSLTGVTDYNVTPDLPFRADARIFLNSSSNYVEFKSGSSWGTTNTSSGDIATATGCGTNREMKIRWAAIPGLSGRPTSFAWLGYQTSEGNPGFLYDQAPSGNPGGATNSPDLPYYFTVSTTGDGSSTPPFSRTSYSHTGDSVSSFGALTVWDFTMNTNGATVTRATSGDWAVSNNMVVNNGTVQFTETTDQGGTTTIGGDLLVSGGRLDQGKTNQDIVVAGNVSLTGGTLQLSDSTGNLKLGGNWTRTGTFDPNGSIVEFNGTAAQTVNNSTTFARFTVSNTTADVTLAGDQTVTTDINITGRLNLSTFNLNGASPLTVASGATLTLGSVDGINSGTGAGNIRTSGTRTFNAGANYIFNSGAAQVTGNGFPATINNLTINNSNGVSLSTATTANGTLTLTSGRLTLGGYTLTLGPSAPAVAGGPFDASNMIVADGAGALCKQFNANGSYTFPIGDNTSGADYSPATLNFTAGTFDPGAQACVRVTDEKHPQNSSVNHYLTRYWTVTQSNIADFDCDAEFNYVDADIVGIEERIYTGKWDGEWSKWAPANTGANLIGDTFDSFSDITGVWPYILVDDPTAITLADFYAQQTGDAIEVTWETASELNNRGFNLYRGTSPDGWDRRLNDALIPSQSQGSPAGFFYTWTDQAELTPGTTYYYWLQDMDLSGALTTHGPVSVDFTVPTAVTLSGVQASPAGGVAALPWLWAAAAAGLALGLGRRR